MDNIVTLCSKEYDEFIDEWDKLRAEVDRFRAALIAIRDTQYGYQDLCWKIATNALGEGSKTWIEPEEK